MYVKYFGENLWASASLFNCVTHIQKKNERGWKYNVKRMENPGLQLWPHKLVAAGCEKNLHIAVDVVVIYILEWNEHWVV